ncbi:MAG: FlgO family outer membrane protein [bacterium]|nr:FlgO family outer membrane protein [bacterium]
MRKIFRASVKVLLPLFLFTAGLWAGNSMPTISLSYFEDLSSGQESSGFSKALAEILISNLTTIEGVQVVERENLQKLVDEMEMGLTGMMNDHTVPKVGKLLGTQYIVAGNYLISEKDVMVQYRIMEVETAAILGSGNVQTSPDKVLDLLLQVSYDIARQLQKISPGIKINKSKMSVPRIDLNRIRDYGLALDLKDRGEYEKAQDILKGLVVKAPDFNQAKKELDRIRIRIVEYDKIREEKLKQESKNSLTWTGFNKLALSYMTSMQYSKLLQYCMKIRKDPPAAPAESMVTASEMIDYYIAFSASQLKKWKIAIEESEKFLKSYPSSMYYQSVKLSLNQGLEEIKTMKSRRENAEKNISVLEQDPETMKDRNYLSYRTGLEYFNGQMYEDALGRFKGISLKELEQRSIPGDSVLYYIFMCYYYLRDKKEGEKVHKAVEVFYPDSGFLKAMTAMLDMFPE